MQCTTKSVIVTPAVYLLIDPQKAFAVLHLQNVTVNKTADFTVHKTRY